MNIDDIKKFLENPIIKQLKFEGLKPSAISDNKPILKVIRTWKSDFSIPEIFYLLKNKNNLDKLNIFCPTCGKKNTLINGLLGYHNHCSSKCSANDESVKHSILNSKLNNIDENGLNSIERGVIKCKNSCLLNIDEQGLNSYQRRSIKAVESGKNNIDELGRNSYKRGNIQAKRTKKQRYNDENYNNRNSATKTNIIKRGVTHHSQTQEWKDLMSIKFPSIKKQRRITNQIKYNNEIYAKSEHRFLLDKNHKNFKDINEQFFRENFIFNNIFNAEKCAEYFGTKLSWVYKHKKLFNIDLPCIKNKEQHQVYEFIKTIYDGEILLDNRKIISPQELDIYIPEKKLAIEFNGIYWHSLKNQRGKYYHQNKVRLCLTKGIRLIHIYEDEWNDEHKQLMLKNLIKNIIEVKIDVKNYVIKEISNEDFYNFCVKYNFSNNIPSIRLGLFKDSTLIHVIGINKKDNIYKLVVNCNNFDHYKDYTKELLQYFKSNYDPTILLYELNLDKDDIQRYLDIGFEIISISQPFIKKVKNVTLYNSGVMNLKL